MANERQETLGKRALRGLATIAMEALSVPLSWGGISYRRDNNSNDPRSVASRYGLITPGAGLPEELYPRSDC